MSNNYLGFYGKLPGQGDFISRRLSRDFINIWDRWLQNSLMASQRMIGDSWKTIYQESPIWRFVLSEKIIDDQIWVGLMIPSFDRVGRFYPLVLVKSWPAHYSGLSFLGEHKNWFDQIENIAINAISQSYTAKELDDDIKQLQNPINIGIQRHSVVLESLSRQDNLVIRSHAGQLLPACATLLESFVKQRLNQYTFWWSTQPKRGNTDKPSLLLAPGLPTEQCFMAMLKGNWQNQGLQDVSVIDLPNHEKVDLKTDVIH